MHLVMYHAEQNALRIFLTAPRCWEDMYDIWLRTREPTSMTSLIEWGWELVGEL